MFRSIFLLALSIAYFRYHYLEVQASTIANPTAFPSATVVPINDFSIILSFSETVQKGGGTLTVGEDANIYADSNLVTMACGAPTAKWFNKVVLVPISRTGGLKAGKKMTTTVPSNCFKAYRSATPTTSVMMAGAYTSQSFTTEAANSCSNTATGTPILVQSGTGSSIPYSPANAEWLSSPASVSFDLYFSESLVAGPGVISLTETTGSSVASTSSSWAPASSAAKQAFDGGGIKGYVKINAGAFKPGAKYALSLTQSAFKDKGNNPTMALFSATDAYHVKVTTTLNAVKFPAHDCCMGSTTTNFTTNHKMVLDFAHHVLPGSGTTKLCSKWIPGDACNAGPTQTTSDIIYLGKKVIVNPKGIAAGKEYNVSIPDTVFLYYSGMSTDKSRKWSYKFSVDASTVVDTAPPVLIAGFVDCDGDLKLVSDTTKLETSCDSYEDGGNDFNEISSTIAADGSSPMKTTAKFMLYFREKIALATSAKATLAADDGSSADITTTGNGLKLGTGTTECMVSMAPTLKTGKKYTLTLGSGQITDVATLKNPYAGTSFSFYTRLTSSTLYPLNTATNVAKETLILVTFSDTPRLGPTPPTESTEDPYLTINDEKLKLQDTNAVKFQEKQILVIPKTPLVAGSSYTVKIPAHQLRYMTTDVSWQFSTRQEDTTKPVVMAYGPTATSIFKPSLDGTAGSPSPSPAYPKVPYVLFTEGVGLGTKQTITIYEGGTGANMYNISASDSTCASGSPCVVIDTTYNSKVWLYPKGKTTTSAHQAAEWATAGRTYTVTLPDASFSDMQTTGVNMNPLDKFSWTFGVSADVAGPTLSSVEMHASKTTGASVSLTGGTISTAHSSMFLTFNEIVAAPSNGKNSMAIKSYDYSTSAPVFSATGTTTLNDKYAIVTLSFDQKVQAGASGTLELYKSADNALLASSAQQTKSATYAGSKVFFKPGTTLGTGVAYYIKAGAKGIKGAGGADAAAINSKSTASLQYVKQQTTVTSRTLSVMYDSSTEYSCTPSTGVFPDATVYFNTNIELQDTVAYVDLNNGTFQNWNTGSSNVKGCDPLATTGNTVCNTVNTANAGKVIIGIGTTAKKYQAVFYLSWAGVSASAPGDTWGFAASTFKSSIDNRVYNAAYYSPMPGPCSTAYDTWSGGSKLVRVYLPPGSTFSQKFTGGVPTMGKQYEIVIPAGAVQDTLGNTATTGSATWNHDTAAPTFDKSASNPATGNVDEYEAVVIAFNEVIQAGTGKFYMYDASNTVGEAFAIDVKASGSEPGAKFFDKYVTITPKTSCYDTRRRVGILNMTNATYVLHCFNESGDTSLCPPAPSNWAFNGTRRLTDEEDSYDASWEGSEAAERRLQTTTCRTLGDLEAGKSYYVTTVATGVVKDVFGNLLAPLNTKSDWSITVQGAASADARAPAVVYASTPTAVYSSTWGIGPTLSGTVMFSEKLKAPGTVSTITLQDCGSDRTCGSGGDDVITTFASSSFNVSYGDGSATDGTKEYGLLKYTKQVPTANSKFKLSIPTSAFADYGGSKAGPASLYSFYFPVGDVNFPTGTDSAAPVVKYATPTATTQLPKGTDVTLWFNEDVQKGSGMVSFCQNSDASSTVDCTTAMFSTSPETPAVFSIDNTTTALDRRVLTMSLPDIKNGQTLYAMIPDGLVKDESPKSNPYAGGILTFSSKAFGFSVIDEDTVAPHLQMISPPISSGTATTILAGDKIKLYFSEAIQAVSGGPNVTQLLPFSWTNVNTNLGVTVAGNQVHLGGPSGTWTAGAKYLLSMGFGAFKDLQGQTLSATTTASPPFLALTGQQFTISDDSAAPTASFTNADPLQTTTAATSTVFELNFNEIVQKGTGKISIYSSGSVLSTTATTFLQDEFDVTSLPLVSALGTDKIMKSSTVVQGSKAMLEGYYYRLVVPNTAYKDTVGQAYAGVTSTSSTNIKKLKEAPDCESPVFLFATMGDTANTGINPAFPASGGKIVMYFSENVQSKASGSVKIQPSTGGSFCSASTAGCLNVGSACATACAFPSADLSDVTLSSIAISGSKVTASVPITLQSGKGYKLTIDRRAFTDAADNSLTATAPGDSAAGMIYTLKVGSTTASTSTDSTGPLHLTTGTPAAVTGTFPTSGATMLPPSTAITISFDETIQAGTGDVIFNTDTKVAVSSCMFSTSFMRCKPSGNLKTKSLGGYFDVSFTPAAIKDAAGNTLRAANTVGSGNSKLTFTTVDLDYMPPTLAAVSGVTYASGATGKSGDYAKPFDPVNGATKVAKGALISMTFSETVQAGAGNIQLNSATVSSPVYYYSGTTVYFQKADMSAGTAYTITTSADGVFKDLNNQPLAKITSTCTATANSCWKFSVVADDTVKPTMLQMLPRDDTTVADDAPSTMITLYFSESVQAMATGKVTVGTTVIPVDNSVPSKGTVTISGGAVSIDPFDDLGYDQNVVINIAADSFKDLFNKNKFDTKTYQFKTPAFSFTNPKINNASAALNTFSQREGSILCPMSGYLLLYGGHDGTGCLSDVWTSTTGATWSSVTNGAGPGKLAYAKTTTDENGCLLVFGESGSCSSDNKNIWKTCGVNSTTSTLEWTSFSPSVKGDAVWSYSETGIAGHGIAIVGGWKMVIVDSVAGTVWNFLDKSLEIVQQVATSVPFSKRSDPILLTDSTNKLYLMGGYDTTACAPTAVSCGKVFTDVWHSADYGKTWACLTANYDKTLTSTYTVGIGRHVGAIMTHDDSMFLIAGAKANYTVSTNDIWAASMPAPETSKPTIYKTSMVPLFGSTSILSDAKVTLYFDEVVSYNSAASVAPHLVDDSNASITLSTVTTISRQVMTLELAGTQKYPAGDTIHVKIPADSLKDAAGNTFALPITYTFKVNTDKTKPTFDSFTTTSNSSAGWDYRATSTTMLILTTDAPVTAVSGVVTCTSPLAGTNNVSFDLSDDALTDVYTYNDGTNDKGMIFLTLSDGVNFTENTEYTINIPAGLVKDLAGNLNAAYDRFKFKTISGKNSYNDYANPIDVVMAPTIPEAEPMVNDTAKPTFVSMWPPVGAGDVLAAAETSVYLFFNEPVKFNATHPSVISIVNNTNKVCGTVNLTEQFYVSTEPIIGAAIEKNATKMTIGSLLKKDQNFTVSVPAGVIVDMKNNPIVGFSKTFKTLAELDDTVAPVVVRASPYNGQSIDSSKYMFDVWFSERVVAGAGSISIKQATTSIPMDITDANVTIAGPKLSFAYYPGALTSSGAGEKSWSLILPAGLLKDAAGNQYRGLNGTGGAATQTFKVTPADTAAPTLAVASDVLPVTEATPGYARATSTALQLKFSESVQSASAGSIIFTPKYTSPTMMIASNSPEVAILGSYVTVSPAIDLMPGEVYGITIDAGAFTDVQGNAYAGLTSGYTISTRASITWSKISTDNFDEGAANYFGGERYGMAVAVDATNKIYVVGGHNGTAGSADLLNDVWMLNTMRDVNCAASIQPTYDCTTDGEMGTDLNQVKACDGATAGKSNFNRTIWKAPSAGGKPCTTVPDGDFATEKGQIIESGAIYCPCPLCTTPPAGLSSEFPQFNVIPDVDDEPFKDDLPIGANLSTLNLTCQTGYEPNASFLCGFDNLLAGKFLEPYPGCELQPCRELPTLANFMSLIDSECNSSMTRFAHESTCSYVCDLGYGAIMGGKAEARDFGGYDGKFTCQQGIWQIDYPGSCGIKRCNTGGAYSSYKCMEKKGSPWSTPTDEPAFGTECKVTCPSGTEVNQLCNMTEANPFGLPEMVAMPGSDSCPTTTAAPAPATKTTAKTTAAAKEKVYITHSLAFEQDFGDKTEDDLMADTAFTASLTTGLVDAVSAAITEFAGKIDASSILLEKFTLSDPARRLTAGTTRRLAVKSLNVDYGVEIPEGVTTDPSALGDTLVANKAAFESTMTASYKAAYEANTGEAPKGFTGVKASDVAGVKTVTVAPPPSPSPSPTPTPTPTPTPSPDGPAPSPGAPAPPAPPAEEESDNTGMIVGIIVGVVLGVGALGGIFYMYKKKKADS